MFPTILTKPLYYVWFMLLLVSTSVMARPDALEHVELQLKWFHQFQFAGYYAAIEQGYYEAAGLHVHLVEGGPNHGAIDAVLSGKAHFGIADTTLVEARIKGKPVVVLATVFQHSPNIILSRKDSGIRGPSDLNGRSIMLSNEHAMAEIKSMFLNEGIELENVEFIPYSGRIDEVVNGEADATLAYITNEPDVMMRLGVEPAILRPSDYGVDFYGDTLFTSERMIDRQPDSVAAFREASMRGWEYALNHTEEVIKLILDLPGVKERGVNASHLRYEAQKYHQIIEPNLIQIGHTNPQRWERIADTLFSAGVVERNRSLKGFIYTNQQRIDPVWFKLAIVAVAATLLLAGMIFFWNLQLRRAVASRTEELQEELKYHQESLETLAETQLQQRALLDAMPDMMFLLDSSGTFLQGHYPDEEHIFPIQKALPYRTIDELMPPEDAKQAIAELQDVLKNQEMVLTEYTLDIDGRDRFFERRTVPCGSERVLTIIREITNRKQVERDFKRLFDEHKTITDSVQDALFKVDLSGRLLWWNKHVEEVTGLGSESLMHMDTLNLVDGRDRGKVREALSNVLNDGGFEVEARRNPLYGAGLGHYKAVLLRDENGEPASIVGMGRDISWLRKSEEQARKLLEQNRHLTQQLFKVQESERRRLSQELHDEFGQWLTAIQAEAMAISRRNDHHVAEIDASAEAIEKSALNMHQAIRSIVDELRPGLLDELGLMDSLRELVNQCETYHPDVICSLQLDKGLDELSDELSITTYRIIQESLTNIFKHANASEVVIALHRGHADEGASRYLELSVEDNGKGMELEANSSGVGLHGMRERVLASGGEFNIDLGEKGGVRIEARIPCGGRENEELSPAMDGV